MRFGSKITTIGVVLGLVVSTTQTGAANQRSGAGDAARADGAGARSVTLITGDRVVLAGDQGARAVRPAAGRERMAFSTFRRDGHLFVVPADAARLVATGRLDRRLFDVTTLIELGYDDASRSTLPLIVTHQDGQSHATVAVAGSTVTRELPSINGSAVTTDKANTAPLWDAVTDAAGSARVAAPGIKTVWLDGKRTASLDRSVPQIGAPAAWAAGYTGTGVKIAVLDTGVDQTHPDLADREVAERNFSDAPDNIDKFGHGTHVASIATGTGARSSGKYKGVAHGANVLDGKVLNDFGGGLESWIIAGMEWAAEEGAKVANLSLGGGDSPELDPLEEAVNNLSAKHGILFVIAAGNSGRPETISSPGSADAALTVGAVDRTDKIAPFSSRGPRIGDGAVKPDITGPGVQIVAALHSAGTIAPPVEPGYTALSGTSMATPHVAGAAALLAQQHPDWTGAQLKATLTASARSNPTLTAFDEGSGRVDVARAITQTVTSQPTNVSLGTVLWPHDDDLPVSKPLTYRNSGDADVTLALTTAATGPDGRPAPSGVFTLGSNQLTVPAHGEAQVTVTGTTRAATLDGAYSGAVVATAGGAAVRTPIAINREVESYNLTTNYRDLNGALTGDFISLVVGMDNDRFAFLDDPDGSVTVRLPKGQYVLHNIVITPGPAGAPHFNLVPYPALSLARDTTIEVDARAARPISVTPVDPASELALGDIGYDVQGPVGSFGGAFLARDLSEISSAHLGPALPADKLTARVNTQWTVPSGAFYGLAWFRFGTVPTGFTKVADRRDLATLQAEFGSVTPGRVGWRTAFPKPAKGTSFAWAVALDVSLPGNRTEYYNTEGNAWSSGLFQVNQTPEQLAIEAGFDSEYRTLRAGRTYQARFNHAVFGPAFPRSDFPWASRTDDFIGITVPLFSDSSGNAGFSNVESGSVKLFRDGELVGESDSPYGGGFDVPAERGAYRLTTEAVRPEIFDVSTAFSGTWTFRSGHVDGERPLPLSAIRFLPELDDTNSAPPGRPFLIPVLQQLQSGSLVRPQRLTVDVSYDEGKTWRRADVLFNLVVRVHHPADATSVSLRAKATDRDGNTVEQTIIRAYKLAEKK